MNRLERHNVSAHAATHEKVVDAAQQYIQDAPVDKTHASLGEYAQDSQPKASEEKTAFFDLQAMRIQREALAGAVVGVISGRIAQKALKFSDGEYLDGYRMLNDMPPHAAFMQGVSDFLSREVRIAISEMNDEEHPHHRLFNFFEEFEQKYQAKVVEDDHAKHMGAMRADTPSCHQSLVDMFAGNYRHDAASLMTANYITAQDLFGELPDPPTLIATTLDAHPHWLAVATHTRLAWQRLLYGAERHRLILEDLQLRRYEYPMPWSDLWQEGFIKAVEGVENPFEKCSTESPLLYRTPGETIISPSRFPQRCCGQIALTLAQKANAAMSEMAYLTESPQAEKGAYSPIDLQFMLGRVASKRLCEDPASRQALIDAKLARDRAPSQSS
jgi:hypothetical protein